MSNNKQSSVEWFAEKLENEATLNYSHAQAHKIITLDVYQFNDLLEQAKAKHYEECKESYYESLLSNFQNFDDYYNETFGGNNED